MSAGMKSWRITPLLGLAFLISAITAAWPLAIFARSAPSKSRVSTRLSASWRMVARGRRFCAAATSSCLTATILFRMSLMGRCLVRFRRTLFQYLDEHAVHDQPHDDEQRRDAQRDPQAGVLPHGPFPELRSECMRARDELLQLGLGRAQSMAARAWAMPSGMLAATLAA